MRAVKYSKIAAIVLLHSIISLSISFADTVILKSGEKVIGNIIKRTPRYIKVESQGVTTIYFANTIDKINSEPASSLGQSIEQIPAEGQDHLQKQDLAIDPVALTPGTPGSLPRQDDYILPEKTQPVPVELSSPKVVGQPPKALFKTAKIIYEIIENTAPYERNISKVVYIDSVNNKRREEETEIFSPGKVQTKKDELNIFDGQKYYHLDLARGVATYVDYSQNQDFFSWIDVPEIKETSFVGEEEILGKRCRIYEEGDLKTWIWRNLIIKQEGSKDGVYYYQAAINIEEDIPFEEHIFRLPDSIKAELFRDGLKTDPVNRVVSRPKVASKKEDTPVKIEEPIDNIAVEKPDSVDRPKQAELSVTEENVASKAPSQQPAPQNYEKTLQIDFTKLQDNNEESNREIVKVDIENISSALELYKADNNNYPSNKQGLSALVTRPVAKPLPENWQGPYLVKLPKDLWGSQYNYTVPGKKNKDYDLYSSGPDCKEGTADDIFN